MKKYAVALLPLILVFIVNGCSKPESVEQSIKQPAAESRHRVISTVPSITEVLFDIGAGDRVVGDSRFTSFPPEADKIEKIGGLYDINWEKIAQLQPDLIVFLDENQVFRQRYGEKTLLLQAVDHRSIEGILNSYEQIGERLGKDVLDQARKKQAELKKKFEEVSVREMPANPLRVMICLDRTREIGRIQNLFIAGTLQIFEEIIQRAGGKNVGSEIGLVVPNLSAEGILQANPDVIIDLLTGEGSVASAKLSSEDKKRKVDSSLADWQSLGKNVTAIKNNHVFLYTEDFTTIPGPRTPLFIEKLRKTLEECKKSP